ncbi:c-type cytochrome biogenesis protein CcmI [Tropicimonas sp. IMCC34043]|uniref:c-type cytochrome biogenesis protein CcmI n=1 Tax=Tropicimonas sp. IMCC34043 TaxID=2248760 RepID=UPI000E27DC9D|nr:c-type cytochrome biogenesis protein CcmI [Tropicimonas sp. IMCC34043]
MSFWILSGLMALIATLAIAGVMLRPRRDEIEDSAEESGIRIYRDQLQTVDRDLARGLITDDEAERLRTEIKRRILDADRLGHRTVGRAPRRLTLAVAAAAGLAVIFGSFLIYGRIGAPGYPDQPIALRLSEAEQLRAERPSQAEFEARMPPNPTPDLSPDFAALMDKLRAAVTENPDELQGWELLARNEARLGNLPAAHAAQSKLIALKGADATAADFSTLAAMMVEAAGGNVSPEADAALTEALKRDPKTPVARYYVGLMYLQVGRPDLTFGFWEPLLRDSTPDAPWVPIIRDRLEVIAQLAGIRYSLPPVAGLAGPSAADMAAAQNMTPEERQDFVRTMVEQLSTRLDEEGGAPEEWARLIQSQGVMGDTDGAAASWAKAQTAYPDPAVQAPIRAAAERAGVATVGPDGRGPTAEDIDDAAKMAPQDRAAMIQSMVAQLSDRLATEGGPPEDWAKLIRALGVMGNRDQAAKIWAEAQAIFVAPAQIDVIRPAAVAAGVAE